jgi:hypothetical protein
VKRYWLIALCVVLLASASISASLVATAVQTSPATRQPLVENPPPFYRDNSGLQAADLRPASDFIDRAAVAARGGEVVLCKLMTFADCCAIVAKDSRETPDIDPQRQVWVVQVRWPDGFNHPRVGLIRNCLATSVFDAETGNVLMSMFRQM